MRASTLLNCVLDLPGVRVRGRCCVSGRWGRSTAVVRCSDGEREFGESCGDPVARVEVDG